MADKEIRLPRPSLDDLLFSGSSGDDNGKSEPVGARIPLDVARAIEVLLAEGREFSEWPKTKSDVVRNALQVWVDAMTKWMLDYRKGSTETGLLHALHLEQSLKNKHSAETKRVQSLQNIYKSTKDLCRFMFTEMQYGKVKEAIDELMRSLKALGESNKDQSLMVLRMFQEDMEMQRWIMHVREKGMEVIILTEVDFN